MALFGRDTGFVPESALGYDEAGLNRMNARHSVFMEPLRREFEGASVLDLASHDGRWSWAALQLGARHVTGIEARGDLIAKGRHLFRGKYEDKAEFIEGDIFDVLRSMSAEGRTFDIVLCLGIFYHVMDHYTLLRLMRGLRQKMIVLDTGLINDEKPFVHLEMESTGNFLNTIAHVEGAKENVVGLVSKGGLRMMCRALQMEVEFLDWKSAPISDTRRLDDYLKDAPGRKQRYSIILR